MDHKTVSDLVIAAADLWPAFSVYERRRRPLAIGIHKDIEATGVLTPGEASALLRYYCGNLGYLRACREGQARVEARLASGLRGHPLSLTRAHARKLRKMAEGEGIDLYGLAGNNDFSSPIVEHRAAQLLYMRDLIQLAPELGAKTVRVFLAAGEAFPRSRDSRRTQSPSLSGIPSTRAFPRKRSGTGAATA